jgi:hypothetical protein
MATSDGWQVKSVKTAAQDDFAELTEYGELLKQLHAAVRLRRQQEADAARARAEAEAALEEARRADEAEKARQRAATRSYAARCAAGDLAVVSLEFAAGDDNNFRVIRQKLGLFIDPGCMNRQGLYQSMSVDIATFQGSHLSRFPHTCRLLDSLIASLNVWFQLADVIVKIRNEARFMAASVEDEIRAISSRTYTYGGSGWGLVLSASAADHAMRQDQKAVQSLDAQLHRKLREAESLVETATERMALHEWRLRKAYDIMSAVIARTNHVTFDVPDDLLGVALRMDA